MLSKVPKSNLAIKLKVEQKSKTLTVITSVCRPNLIGYLSQEFFLL